MTAPAATCRAVLALDRASLAGTLLAPLVRPAQDLARTLLRYYEHKELEAMQTNLPGLPPVAEPLPAFEQLRRDVFALPIAHELPPIDLGDGDVATVERDADGYTVTVSLYHADARPSVRSQRFADATEAWGAVSALLP